MSAPKFVDSHNMVVFLAKPTETILGYCKGETINGEVRLQALVDGKKVLIIKTSVRRDLQLEDAEGIECLPNADIFKQLALMGYEKPSQNLTFYKAFFSPQWKFLIHTILQCLSAKSWNEFSSTMASAIICLATNQKFKFSKYIFESMVKNMDSSVKFLMYPRFVQVFLDKQVGDMPTHDKKFVTPSHTKKLKKKLVKVQLCQLISITHPSFNHQLHNLRRNNLGENREKTLRFLNPVLLPMIHFLVLEKKKRSRNPKLKRLFKIGRSAQVISSEDEGLGDQDDASKQGRKIEDIDKDAEVTLVIETQGRYDDAQMFDTNVFNGEEVFVA
ncbi:hypothetical protein Tco_0776388 [Tanacetum coccineum]